MTLAQLAPHAALLAALTVLAVLFAREGHRNRTRPGHGQQRPHSRHVGTKQQDHNAIEGEHVTRQLALEIPPQRVPPAVVLRVDEIGIAQFATRESAHRWELLRARMPGRFTTVAVRMPGDLVDVTCDDRAHAQWLAALLHSWGVPKTSLTVRTATEEPTP